MLYVHGTDAVSITSPSFTVRGLCDTATLSVRTSHQNEMYYVIYMAAKNPRVLYRHQLHKGPRLRRRPRAPRRPQLTIGQILKWIDDYRAETGKWPKAGYGRVGRFVDETWTGLQIALLKGFRGLPGGSSIVQLLIEYRGYRDRQHPPSLTVPQILVWIDAYRKRTREWPKETSGPIPEATDESWWLINKALSKGLRGLPGSSSLAELLAEHRGVRNVQNLPHLRIAQILRWADAHHERTGEWPKLHSGPIAEEPTETWCAVSMALRVGVRGLPGGSSLTGLLEQYRGVRNHLKLSPLNTKLILKWADHHYARTGTWPGTQSGEILAAKGEIWTAVNAALLAGHRGLPGGSSLARLLAAERGARNNKDLPPLSEKLILAWADSHYQRTGQWPKKTSGSIVDAPSEKWISVGSSLLRGRRGLKGGCSLAQFLSKHRGVKNHLEAPPLNLRQILAWADAHQRRTGQWPTHLTGRIEDAPTQTWYAIQSALQHGGRGLPGGSTLARVLAEHRGRRNKLDLSKLNVKLILKWADAHHKRYGKWPLVKSGPILNAPGETWSAVNSALERGIRGLDGGSSLARLLAQRGRKRNPQDLPLLNAKLILTWADAHHKRTGTWPTRKLGAIVSAPEEAWSAVDTALRAGCRGLPGGSSLLRLLERNGRIRSVAEKR
ncbi:MAG TPA: hypothetical protein VG097_00500 [Gemmata sp.]|nr:hypothetical protein [Gemmata sp.]